MTIQQLLNEKSRISASGKELLGKINAWRIEKQQEKRKKMSIVEIMNSNLYASSMAKDYYLNIEKPINRINEILNKMYKQAEGKSNFRIEDEGINPIGIEKEFFCYKEVPFAQ